MLYLKASNFLGSLLNCKGSKPAFLQNKCRIFQTAACLCNVDAALQDYPGTGFLFPLTPCFLLLLLLLLSLLLALQLTCVSFCLDPPVLVLTTEGAAVLSGTELKLGRRKCLLCMTLTKPHHHSKSSKDLCDRTYIRRMYSLSRE